MIEYSSLNIHVYLNKYHKSISTSEESYVSDAEWYIYQQDMIQYIRWKHLHTKKTAFNNKAIHRVLLE